MENKGILILIFYIMLLFVLILVIVGVILVIVGAFKRCPHCRKAFALKEFDSTLINKGKTSKLERHYSYNKKGERTGSREVRVYGTRKTYEVNYMCKYCGKTTTKIESIDIY